MKNRGKIYLLLLIFILIINTVAVYADNGSIDKDKQRLQQTNQKINSLKSQLNEKKSEYTSITDEIKKLDHQIAKVDSELQELENELAEINHSIEKTEAELVKAENNITNKKDTLNKRLRVMYKNGMVGYLEVLLNSEDLSDFLTRLDMVQSIISHDAELLKYMKEQRDTIKEKKAHLENQKNMMLATKNSIQHKKNELVVVTRAKENFMKSLKQDIKELEKQEDELLALAKKLEEEIRRKQISAKYAGGEMAWPAPGYYRITSPFGYRIHPIFKTRKMHTGIDIGVPYGGTIVAANNGVVQYAGWLGGYGQVVWIDHGGGISTLYAHNSRLLVKEGQNVKRGQAIAKAGSTGNSTGPHLHFEVRKNGKYVDPLPWVKGN